MSFFNFSFSIKEGLSIINDFILNKLKLKQFFLHLAREMYFWLQQTFQLFCTFVQPFSNGCVYKLKTDVLI